MKLFICALVVLALIASFCVFGAVACAALIDEMVDLLDTAAPQGGDVIPPQAESGTNIFSASACSCRITIWTM